ncbi:MAG TPA: glutathione S-transferase family protein [Steroidobacteraceae bacterium]|nr:glutathione S-transferase family protein [Steroidobacteraceae bacterium]
MLTFYDYLPSQNGWKVRQMLRHLALPHRTELVSIFEGAGQTPEYRAVNPTGAVPAIRLDDGRVLSESNAILVYLAHGTPYLPAERYAAAKVHQWLSFEQMYVESTIGSLRFWTLTGKLAKRPAPLVEGKRNASLRSLAILDAELATRPFIAGETYTIADISLFAYAHRADDIGMPVRDYPNLAAWIERLEAQPGFDATHHPYSTDPYAERELP